MSSPMIVTDDRFLIDLPMDGSPQMDCDNDHLGTSMPVGAVAVGTEITLRPPHRTRRALLTHRAPTLDGDEEPLLRPRMQDAWEWQVPVSDRLHSGPRQSAPLATAHEG